MNIQCDNCGTQHELDPPSWVISSGRAFRFRCSACGSSQSVLPKAAAAPDHQTAPTVVPTERSATPVPAGASAPRSVVATPTVPEETPTVGPPALIDSPAPAPTRTETPLPPAGEDEGVFLKQNGQIYMVRDWATLERWIAERRVDQSDLVSEGGVRWEPIGTRPELAPLFGLVSRDTNPTASNPPGFPFGADTPFGAPTAAEVWTDDDTEGIPPGLPPLPTEDSDVDGGEVPWSDRESGWSEGAVPWEEPEDPAPEVVHREAVVAVVDTPDDLVDAPLPERGMELGGPEPWELGLLEPDPDLAGPSMVEDDIDTPYTELRYEPTEEFYTDAFDTMEGVDPVEGTDAAFIDGTDAAYIERTHDPRHDEAEVDAEETELHLGPTPSPSSPRLEVVPSPHPSPYRRVESDRATPSADVFAFDDSTQPGPDRLPPIATPRANRAKRNIAAGLSPSGTVTQLRRPPPKSAAQREAPTLEPLTEFPFDVEWDEETVKKAPRSRWLLAAAVLSTFVVLVGVAWFVGPMIGGVATAPAEPIDDPPPHEAPDHPPEAPAVAPEIEAAAAPAPVLKPAPALPEPPPKPTAVPEPTESVAKLIKRGWDLADDDRPKAEKLFRRAVDLAPRDDEAAYGYGYVLLMQGRTADAAKYLCRARKAKRADTRQDVNGMISNYGLECP